MLFSSIFTACYHLYQAVMLPLERRFYSREWKKVWWGQVEAVEGMIQRCDIVLGKIHHYVTFWVAQRAVMAPPPIVGDNWANTNNAFSQSCEDFRVKTALTICPGGTNSLWMTLCRSKSPCWLMSMNFRLDLLILAFLGRRKEGVCHSKLCHLLSRSYSNTHILSPITTLSKTSKFSFTWWIKSWKIALRLAFCSSDNTRDTNFAHTFLIAKYSVMISKTWV